MAAVSSFDLQLVPCLLLRISVCPFFALCSWDNGKTFLLVVPLEFARTGNGRGCDATIACEIPSPPDTFQLRFQESASHSKWWMAPRSTSRDNRTASLWLLWSTERPLACAIVSLFTKFALMSHPVGNFCRIICNSAHTCQASADKASTLGQ